ISRLEDVRRVIEATQTHYGSLQGVFHAAGLNSSVDFKEAKQEELQAVLAPKVVGTIYLDQATKDIALDFFVVFSSISSEIGDFGVGSYALANRFLDDYMTKRAALVFEHRRFGKSLSVNWPYWLEGGMQVAGDSAVSFNEVYFNYAGMTPLAT